MLDKKYKNLRTAFEEAEIVDLPYWNKIKERRLKEFQNEYNLTRITIKAYRNPSVLLSGRFSSLCNEYSVPLASLDSSKVVELWREFMKREASENADTDEYLKRFEKKLASRDWLLHARVDLITYGWHNCVNDSLKHLEVSQDMLDEYKKLFKSISEDCQH